MSDNKHLARELRRMVKAPQVYADVRVASTAVELAFWVDGETRALLIECGRSHMSLKVRRTAERIVWVQA